jgi:outer membrane lipoprotein SlyB
MLLLALAGCGRDYSPNTYSTAAVQQANKVEQGVVAGFREVAIRADGTVGAVTGGAAGGVLGAQVPDGGVVTALGAIGGTLIGSVVGTTAEHVAGDTKAFEYVVRKTNGELVSVTQKDTTPLAIGLKVLVIEGKQARIVADYSVPVDTAPPAAAKIDNKNESRPETKSADRKDTIDTRAAPASERIDSVPAPALAPAEVASPEGLAPDASPPQAAATPTAPPTPLVPELRQTAPAAQPQPALSDQDSSPPPTAPAPSSSDDSGPTP